MHGINHSSCLQPCSGGVDSCGASCTQLINYSSDACSGIFDLTCTQVVSTISTVELTPIHFMSDYCGGNISCFTVVISVCVCARAYKVR